VIKSSQPCAFDEGGGSFAIRIAPHGAWQTDLDVAIALLGPSADQEPTLAWVAQRPRTNIAQDLERFVARAPRLECDWDPLTTTYRRSLVDLAAPRFTP